jgi:hypothetical protein
MFMRLIKQLLKQNKQIESLKEMLFSHKYFNITETFALFDEDGDGVINAQELEEGFAKFNITFNLEDLERLVVNIGDDDEDGTIDMREFVQLVTPRSSEYKTGGKGSMGHLPLEQRKTFQQAQMETMAWLFDAMISADAEFQEKKEQLQLDAESLYDQINEYK